MLAFIIITFQTLTKDLPPTFSVLTPLLCTTPTDSGSAPREEKSEIAHFVYLDLGK